MLWIFGYVSVCAPVVANMRESDKQANPRRVRWAGTMGGWVHQTGASGAPCTMEHQPGAPCVSLVAPWWGRAGATGARPPAFDAGGSGATQGAILVATVCRDATSLPHPTHLRNSLNSSVWMRNLAARVH